MTILTFLLVSEKLENVLVKSGGTYLLFFCQILCVKHFWLLLTHSHNVRKFSENFQHFSTNIPLFFNIFNHYTKCSPTFSDCINIRKAVMTQQVCREKVCILQTKYRTIVSTPPPSWWGDWRFFQNHTV